MQTWVAAQPVNPTTDQARVSLGEVFVDNDPKAALDMALTINNPIKRSDSVAKFFHRWRKANDAAAQQWLQGQWKNLAPDLQERITVVQQKRLPPK